MICANDNSTLSASISASRCGVCGNVRFGTKSDSVGELNNVRFDAESGTCSSAKEGQP
jgi:hypothetical protein